MPPRHCAQVTTVLSVTSRNQCTRSIDPILLRCCLSPILSCTRLPHPPSRKLLPKFMTDLVTTCVVMCHPNVRVNGSARSTPFNKILLHHFLHGKRNKHITGLLWQRIIAIKLQFWCFWICLAQCTMHMLQLDGSQNKKLYLVCVA